MKKSNYGIKPVPMYDLFSKGNYIGSFRTKSDAEGEILRRLGMQCIINQDLEEPRRRSRLEEYLWDMAFTTIRSTHYRMTGGPRISGRSK